MRQKLELLEQYPDRKPGLATDVRKQLEELTGSQRRGGGLRLAADSGVKMIEGTTSGVTPDDYLAKLKKLVK